jgi:peptide-methionine (S)-S-oxide reductase
MKVECRATVIAALFLGLQGGQPVAAANKLETAVLAGGCFWGVEGVFEHVKGVQNVVSGYAGGIRAFGTGSPRTNFAEAVKITFDPAQISYDQLLDIFASVAHDPTQVDRQGPDVGPRYRSAIFPLNAQQRQAAQRFLEQLRASGRYKRPIATRVESGRFEVAEREHQDYMRKNPSSRYVIVHDLPKLAELRREYPQLWRE